MDFALCNDFYRNCLRVQKGNIFQCFPSTHDLQNISSPTAITGLAMTALILIAHPLIHALHTLFLN